ncbi:MAG: hypothetical protein EOR26_05030 [Mesorhizobium sp.]|uniref:hypothetical protein n=1 Tax=unclassified Mesorhizobium TaxID=325217 RepID=UPI000FCB26B2|nr:MULTISPECIES: hypothetical protein [unclassified Mesorhizobium]RUV66219.1 hypothetical protein EOA78_35035 [Mesorhizobium sp. M5C.F.Cr.IN.023.01.1.1]RWI51064.1 MAG: hypothetical protein EOR15_06610 [Mesorhizobium sp.]RWI62052.1 MAG: hypothetical protein EOR16_03810 [Mesorhizobium sp.]RWJ13902.1 MAG: hypothetical protein EOR24_01065 [Mesorhizobium sp.]RWJ16872.1 MAG: hypothetical protein EOR25_13375 [Mesorhizobium sp.]
MSQGFNIGRWSGGLAEWTDDDTAYLSVAFTWRLNDAYQRARWYKAAGYKVRAGGPGIFTRKHFLADVAEIGGSIPDAVVHHNPMATFASRGCPVGCWFCIVPKMEGKAFTLLPDFPVRPVLCDNNLSALPADYQDHIVSRYLAAAVPLLDANSGFEPRTFDDDVYQRWKVINRGPWRFAYDDMAERSFVERVMRMLAAVSPRQTRVYVLIGNEPFAACMERIREVMAWGGEPHVQPFMKLNALERRPFPRFDWNEQLLRDVARWANSPMIWRKTPFSDYRRSAKTRERYDEQVGMFV